VRHRHPIGLFAPWLDKHFLALRFELLTTRAN